MQVALVATASISLVTSTPLAAPAEFGGRASPRRIVGGELVPPGEWPGVVAFSLGPMLCSGVMLTPRFMLTAAHCLESYSEDRMVPVFSGAMIDLATAIPAVRVWKDPEYCSGMECSYDRNDFALMELERDLPGFEGPPWIVTTDSEWKALVSTGRPVTVVGYGQSEKTIGEKRSFEALVSGWTPGGTEFLAGGRGRDSCGGDSGGPVFARSSGKVYLVGVTARGSRDCGDGGFYGSAAHAMCWIASTGVDLVAAGCPTCRCTDAGPSEAGCGVLPRSPTPFGPVVIAAIGFPIAWRRRPSGARDARP